MHGAMYSLAEPVADNLFGQPGVVVVGRVDKGSPGVSEVVQQNVRLCFTQAIRSTLQ